MTRRAAPMVLACYGAGLLTGLAHFGAPRVVIPVLLLGSALAARHHPSWAFAFLLASVARLAALVTLVNARGDCAAQLPPGRIELTLRLVELPDPRGGLIEALPEGGWCQGAILTRWLPGDTLSAPGTDAHVVARWLPDTVAFGPPSGLLLVESLHRGGNAATLADRLRGGIARQSRVLYGSRGGVVEALILNRRASMAAEMRQKYARAGLIHLLSISGFHVGLIAAWIILLGKPIAIRWGRAGAIAKVPLVAAGVAAAYVAFLGWPAPAARAALLVVIVAIERRRQRRVDADSLLAFIALVLLVADPWSVTSLGAWLSFLSLWGAAWFVGWSDRVLSSKAIVRVVSGSVGALVATAWLTAAVLGMVSLAGIALNIIAIPLAAVTLPAVIASVVLAPVVPAVAAALAAGSGLGLAALDGLASLGAAIPGLAVEVPAAPASSVPWLLLFLAALWATQRPLAPAISRWRWVAVTAGAAWLFVLADLRGSVGARDAGLTLHFLDVGQGDAALVHTPGGQWIVIDAGPRGPAGDAGRKVVVPELERHGAVSIAALVLSHPHLDHIGGAEAVLEALPVGVVVEPGDLVADSVYLGLLDAIAARHSRWRGARTGDTLVVDSVRLVIEHPDPDWPDRGLDLNEDSAVLRLEFGGCKVLFSGDAGFDAEGSMVGRVGAVDLLKVGHHGSRGSSSDAWLSALAPSAAIISVGARNRYGHPAPETMARLAAHQIQSWRTDQDGEVTVRVRDGAMEISSRRASARIPCHSTDS